MWWWRLESLPNSRSARIRRSKRSEVSTRPSRTGTAARLRMWSFFGSRPVVSRSMLTHWPAGAGCSRPAHSPSPNLLRSHQRLSRATPGLVLEMEAVADVPAELLDHVQRVAQQFPVEPAQARGIDVVAGGAALGQGGELAVQAHVLEHV